MRIRQGTAMAQHWSPTTPHQTNEHKGAFSQSANYDGVYPRNTPEDHPPTEACMIKSSRSQPEASGRDLTHTIYVTNGQQPRRGQQSRRPVCTDSRQAQSEQKTSIFTVWLREAPFCSTGDTEMRVRTSPCSALLPASLRQRPAGQSHGWQPISRYLDSRTGSDPCTRYH